MLLVHAAWLDAARFLDRGIQVDELRLGVESVKRVGPGGDFLTDDLTLRLLQEREFFNNDLFDLSGDANGVPILEQARLKVDDMSAGVESPLPHDLQEKLRRYFHDARGRQRR